MILIHGACARMQQFVHIIRRLSAQNYELVAYDALGCSLSDKPNNPSAYRTSEMYADMVALIEKLPGQSVSIIGHSIGGAMVVRFGSTHPKASSLTKSIIALTPPHFISTHEASQSMNIFKLPYSILWLIRPLMSMKARVLLFGPKATDALKNMEREASARNPVYMFQSFYTGVDRNMLASDKLGKTLKVPCLFVGADSDKLCPVEGVKSLADHFGGNFVVATECGHQCMQEDPEQILGHMQKFFSTSF
jgi:pimeloyl-ACP methyl ester carboxylesterase